MRIQREKLLHELQLVEAGLSAREIIEQSSCFVFRNKTVFTFNDEVACSCACSLNIEGAIQAKPLLAILSKLEEDELAVELKEGEIVFKGKNKRTGVRMEKEFLLPIDSVEMPDESNWVKMPADFGEAVKLVQSCASNDQSRFVLTCIQLTKSHIQACDGFQVTRCKIKMPLKSPTLIKRDALKDVSSLDMTELNETDTWLHFRNPMGLVYSCRRYVEDFPNIDHILDFTGSKAVLPKGLSDAAEKASVFADESTSNAQVTVELKPGKLRIKGQGVAGWYNEIKKVRYKGPALMFLIQPNLLVDITKRHNECEITPGRLKVDGGKFVYVTALGTKADAGDE